MPGWPVDSPRQLTLGEPVTARSSSIALLSRPVDDDTEELP
ncbi:MULTISPECIES: hypothetical protein [unclassified Micromonospora]